MIKDKLPDGFPVGSDVDPSENYPCDNCGERFDANEEGILADATGSNGEYHKYAFCSYDCACDFAEDNDLLIDRYPDGPVDVKFTIGRNGQTDDPVAAAVKSINVGGVSTDGANEEATEELEPVPEELVQATLAAEAERQDTGLHERKVLQVWDRVVSNAQEIAQLASEIEEKNNELKALKKDYEALVKRQNTYILQNGDGIQTTFADLDNADDSQSETEAKPDVETTEETPEVVDTLAWRDEPVTTLKGYGLTEKQTDKAQEAFGTLGRLQDWLCADYRDKQPGIGQVLQDKLTEALNKYTETVYAEAKADAEATEEV